MDELTRRQLAQDLPRIWEARGTTNDPGDPFGDRAVALSDRVIVLSPRARRRSWPTSAIDLPRPPARGGRFLGFGPSRPAPRKPHRASLRRNNALPSDGVAMRPDWRLCAQCTATAAGKYNTRAVACGAVPGPRLIVASEPPGELAGRLLRRTRMSCAAPSEIVPSNLVRRLAS